MYENIVSQGIKVYHIFFLLVGILNLKKINFGSYLLQQGSISTNMDLVMKVKK